MKYKEIMNKVEVTDEMRERVLANISKEASKKKKTVLSFPNWKQLSTLAACAAIVLLCVTVLPGMINTDKPEEDTVSIVNGIIDCQNISDLSQQAGVEIYELTAIPFDVSDVKYTLWFEIAQIEYIGDNNSITYRIGKSKEDISGDYNDYPKIREEVIQNNRVTIKGYDEKACLAIWNDGKYSYAISSSEGISYTDMLVIIESLLSK